VLLGRRGVPVFDADAAVHELYRAAEPGAAAVNERFGPGVMAENGSVDRAALARRVVGDDEAIESLNQAIHPLVRSRVAAWLGALRERAKVPPVAVVEAALLVETGSYRDYDALVVVWCRPEQQLERAVVRGMDEPRARGLLESQLDMDAKRAVADVLIDNSGLPEDLPDEVDRAWLELGELCEVRTAAGSEVRGPRTESGSAKHINNS
jgi:dephospho-CoA kinase